MSRKIRFVIAATLFGLCFGIAFGFANAREQAQAQAMGQVGHGMVKSPAPGGLAADILRLAPEVVAALVPWDRLMAAR